MTLKEMDGEFYWNQNQPRPLAEIKVQKLKVVFMLSESFIATTIVEFHKYFTQTH